MRSRFLRLNLRDLIKGLFLAIVTAIITFLITELQNGANIDIELLKKVGITALIALLSYILKNFLTNSEGKILTSENKKTE